MKKKCATVRRLKLTSYELRVAIDALNAKRLKQKAYGVDNSETSELILLLLDALKLRYSSNLFSVISAVAMFAFNISMSF